MRVCFIVTGLGIGGAERQVVDLAMRFDEIGHDVLIISLTGNTDVQVDDKKIKIVELKIKKNIFGIVRGLFKANVELRNFNPDVVHSHMVHANIFSRILRLFRTMPALICSAHNTNEGGRLRMLAYRITDSLSTLNTNVTQAGVNAFIEMKAVSKMIVVPNGIDFDRFYFSNDKRKSKRESLGLTESQKIILAIGRLEEQKDYFNLINAFSKVLANKKKDIDVKLFVVGDGVLRESLMKTSDELGLTEHVEFVGIQHDVDSWLCACDIYVMSSEWEGMPLVIVEAMASERLIIATDCGGIKEMLGGNGIVVPIKNSEQLSNGMIKALNISDRKIAAITRSGMIRAKNTYSLNNIANKWIDIYNSVL